MITKASKYHMFGIKIFGLNSAVTYKNQNEKIIFQNKKK